MKDINEAAAPAKIERKLLEKDVQKQCVNWARARGYWARKFSSQSQRSVPDYLFARELHYTGSAPMRLCKFACEFKAPGKTSTNAQLYEQEHMRLAGWFVFECDNFAIFRLAVLTHEQEAA